MEILYTQQQLGLLAAFGRDPCGRELFLNQREPKFSTFQHSACQPTLRVNAGSAAVATAMDSGPLPRCTT